MASSKAGDDQQRGRHTLPVMQPAADAAPEAPSRPRGRTRLRRSRSSVESEGRSWRLQLVQGSRPAASLARLRVSPGPGVLVESSVLDGKPIRAISYLE